MEHKRDDEPWRHQNEHCLRRFKKEDWRIIRYRRICWCIYDNKKSVPEAQRLHVDLPGRQPGGAHHQGPPRAGPFSGQLWGKRCRRTWETKSYVMWRGQFISEYSQARQRTQEWLKKNPWMCRRRRSGLLAHLTTAVRIISCGASLSYRSIQSLRMKSRAWSKRWSRWLGPLTGTPWQRPARG